MDSLRLDTQNNPEGATEVLIYINERNLIEILREFERPFALREGHPTLAGGYAGLPPSSVAVPSTHFLGQAKPWYTYGNKVSVLECECGCAGCWPFLVKITITPNQVSWSDFEQPHRGVNAASGYWDYIELTSFVFDRAQYEAELAHLAQKNSSAD